MLKHLCTTGWPPATGLPVLWVHKSWEAEVKFTTWCVGVLQILLGLMLAWSVAPAWRWVWVATAVVWALLGLVLAGVALARLATGRFRMGAGLRGVNSGRPAPTEHKEE